MAPPLTFVCPSGFPFIFFSRPPDFVETTGRQRKASLISIQLHVIHRRPPHVAPSGCNRRDNWRYNAVPLTHQVATTMVASGFNSFSSAFFLVMNKIAPAPALMGGALPGSPSGSHKRFQPGQCFQRRPAGRLVLADQQWDRPVFWESQRETNSPGKLFLPCRPGYVPGFLKPIHPAFPLVTPNSRRLAGILGQKHLNPLA